MPCLPVIEPDTAMPVKKSTIFLGPADRHMIFEGDRVIVHRGPKEHSTRPAVDPLFRSAALSFASRVSGLLLSGAGDDGVDGLITIKEHGGICLVQDPDEADLPYMPMNAIRYDNVDASLPVKDLGPVLDRLARGEMVRP